MNNDAIEKACSKIAMAQTELEVNILSGTSPEVMFLKNLDSVEADLTSAIELVRGYRKDLKKKIRKRITDTRMSRIVNHELLSALRKKGILTLADLVACADNEVIHVKGVSEFRMLNVKFLFLGDL